MADEPIPPSHLPLACIICDHKPSHVAREAAGDPDSVYPLNQPWGATVFRTYGQFGSTVFDERGRAYLEINVCDTCMKVKAARGLIAEVRPVRPPMPPPTYSCWKPYEPDGEEEE